jgi:hypothetical protein
MGAMEEAKQAETHYEQADKLAEEIKELSGEEASRIA